LAEVKQSQGLTWKFLLFSLPIVKKSFGYIFLLALAWCLLFGCSVSPNASQDKRTDFPMRFVLDKSRDLKETISGNTFVATLPGIHPVFGEALTIRVRGLQAESIKEKDPRRAALAFDQWLRFKRAMEDARMVELRNIERGAGDFWVWADLYLDGRLIQ
jgi:hypothetical protein